MTANSDIPFAKSLVDYIFRWLGMQFIDGYRERNAPVRASRAAAETAPADSRTTQEERAWNQSRTDRTLASPGAPAGSKSPSPQSSTRTSPASETEAAPSHPRVIVTEQFAEVVETIDGDRQRRTTIASASVSSLDQSNANLMGDAPACDVCGSITVRNGSCYRCLNCGQSMGCS
jgi:ribonucleoside-diphosphate reductase alpha chain